MDPSSGGANVRDSAGVHIYQVNRGSPEKLRLTTAPLVRIASDVAGEYALYRIRGVTRLGDGSFVVSNNGTELLFFDRTGHYVWTVGKRGEGAGEFVAINNVAAGPGDTLFVYDTRLDRLTIIAPSGVVVEAVSLRHDRAGAFDDLLGVSSSGDLVLSDISYLSSSSMSGEVSLPFDIHLFDRSSGDGRVVGSYRRSPTFRYVTGNRSTTRPIPFHSSPAFALYDDMLFVGMGDEGEVRVESLSGTVRSLYRLGWEPEPVRQADVERYREERVARTRSEGRRAVEREILSAMDFPGQWPFYQDLKVDPAGWIWLREDGPDIGDDLQRWIGFDPAGQGTRILEIAGDFRLISFGPATVIGINRDEFDVERVVVHGLESLEGESE